MKNQNRKTNRLRKHDYFQPGYYFITICTQNKQRLFGKITDRQMVTNDAGKMIERTWDELPKFYRGIQIDQFQIMPNHIHGIIVIAENDPSTVGTGPRACPHAIDPNAIGSNATDAHAISPRVCPHAIDAHATDAHATNPRVCLDSGQPQGVVPTMSLSDVVHRFKSFTTHKYMAGMKNDGWKSFDGKLWQRSFYDHIVRNEKSLDDIRAYIQNNPLKWELDTYNSRKWMKANG